MANINELIRQADEIFEKRAAADGSVKTAAALDDTDVFELARQLRQPAGQKTAAAEGSAVVTVTEKVAEAVAILDTLINLKEMDKIASFEAKAKAAGYTAEQISGALEKRASQMQLKSVLQLIPWLNPHG